MSTILVLDDDPHIQRTLDIMLRHDGHTVLCAASGEDALTLLQRESADVALVDLQLPGMGGIEFLKALRQSRRDVAVIIITAYGSIETAVDAMKEGAYDYLTKPFSPDQVRHRLSQLEELRNLKAEVTGLRRRLGDMGQEGFLTCSPPMLQVLETARAVAPTDTTILITGESGTGKNLLARLIHNASARQQGRFAIADCSSFHETLLESELFGHRRGAFTGAVFDRPGKVETAQGGTLFLDEVGEIPLPLQGKLLRLVEERAYERVGDPAPCQMDARVIVATNRNLEEMVAEKAFRQDLFFRLSVVELHIPALRARPEDIPLLIRHFLHEFNRIHARNVEQVDPGAERILLNYSWPGNVRELANLIERCVLLSPNKTLHTPLLPPRVFANVTAEENGDSATTLAELEENHIRKALALGLSLEDTAARLGIDPSTLWRKRKKYGI